MIQDKVFLLILIVFLFYSSHSIACERVNRIYLDPEVILNHDSRASGVIVLDAKAVRSKDYRRIYFVQYKMLLPEDTLIYPMFAMNKATPKDGGYGVIYSMDDLAITLSGYGDGRTIKPKFSRHDHGYSQASKCLKN